MMIISDKNGIEVEKQCPMCGRFTKKILNTKATSQQITDYYYGRILIQDAFPDLSANEREFIKTGYCDKCQNILFAPPEDEDDDELDDEKKMECMNCDKEHAKECTETNCLYKKYLEEKGE